MSEEPKFLEAGFNLMNYEDFVNQSMKLNKQLKAECVIPVSKKCGTIIKQEVVIPEKIKNPGSCTFPCNVGSGHFEKTMCDLGSRISLMLTRWLSHVEFIGISNLQGFLINWGTSR